MQQVNPVRIDGSVLQCSAFMFSRVLSIALLRYKVPAPIATLGNLHMASSVIFQKYCVMQHFHKYPLMSNRRIHWYLQDGEFFVFNHWNFAFQRFFCFQTIWFEVASTSNFLFFHLQRHLLAILARSFIRVSQERVRSQKFQEHVRSVATTACQELQTQKKVLHNKNNAHEENVITPPPTPPVCRLVHVWDASERYHNQVGNIKIAFSYGVAFAAPLANTSICVSHSKFHSFTKLRCACR